MPCAEGAGAAHGAQLLDLKQASESLVVAYRNGAPIKLNEVARVIDSVENINTLGLFNGQPAVIVLITRQPGANVIKTVDGVRALLPELRARLEASLSQLLAPEGCGRTTATLSPPALLESLFADVRDFTKGAAQSDDITAMVLQYGG